MYKHKILNGRKHAKTNICKMSREQKEIFTVVVLKGHKINKFGA